MIALLLAVTTALAQDCENPEWIANETEEYIGNFMLEDASTALQRAEISLGCSEAADPTVLARLFNAEGMIALLTDDTTAATLAFGAAARTDPETWEANYGEQARKAYDMAAATLGLMGKGTIKMLPEPVDLVVTIDGAPATAPFELAAGLHMVQIGKPDSPSSFAKRVNVLPGEVTQVATGLVRGVPTNTPGEVVVVVRSPIPPIAEGFSSPFAKGDDGWADGAGAEVDFKTIRQIAAYDHDADKAAGAMGFGRFGGTVGLPMAVGGGYASYVLLWDLTTGHNMEVNHGRGRAVTMTSIGLGTALLGSVLTINAFGNKKRKAAVVEGAGRVVDGEAL